jgi:aspartate/methionine/tyrosine aminotransferase
VLDELWTRDGARPRILVLNYPSNPTGTTCSRDRLGELAAVCRRHGVIVLSDEIYGELQFDGSHRSIAALYEEGAIVSTGLSKWCGAGGWRLGVLSFPARLRRLSDALTAAASETYSTTSAPIQYAAVEAFAGSAELDAYLADVRRVLGLLMPWCAAQLRWAGLRVAEPRGAFYLFPSFEPLRRELLNHGIRTDRELAARLLMDAGISCLPGVEFGVSPDSLFVRLALVDFDGAVALSEAARNPLDETFLHEHLGRVARAIGALCAWCRAL